jgi:hypothetical protein
VDERVVRSSTARASGVGYGVAWLQAFLTRGSGLVFDAEQATQVAALAERALDIARAVFTVLARRVTEGEIEDVRHVLPSELRELWPADARGAARWPGP